MDGAELLKALDLPSSDEPASESTSTFLDGARVRFEVPSVEGPEVLEAVLEEAGKRHLPVHRVSQGSGVSLLTDTEVSRMVLLGAQAGIEISLFLSPKAAQDTGAMARAAAGQVVAAKTRGASQLAAALDELQRGYALGVRSFLVADEGLLGVIGDLKRQNLLPADFALKASVMMGGANPASIRWAHKLGATTYNVPTDLSVGQLSALRRAVALPLDIYLESPDDLGGFVRYRQWRSIAQAAAPVYLKFGLSHAPALYPSGLHWQKVAITMARERMHRFEVLWEEMRREGMDAWASPTPVRASDLAVPVPSRPQ